MKKFQVVIQQGEALQLTSGWVELAEADGNSLYLVPVRFKRIGLARYFLLPVGKQIGGTALSVEIAKTE